MEIKELFQRPLEYLRHVFVTGFIFLLPLTITYSLFSFLFSMIKKWLVPIRSIEFPFIENIPHHEIFILILFIFIIGASLKAFLLQHVIVIFEEIIGRIPLIRTVYKGTKQLVHAFTSHDHASFKKVVIIEYPRQGIYSFGFLTKDIPSELINKNLCGVYVPHTPNPATGNFIMVPKEHVFETDLTRHEATALIISGGIVQPNRFIKNGTQNL